MEKNKLTVAYSPCPNDTFIFHAWADGQVSKELPMCPVLADVQALNEWVLQGKYSVSKASINCLGKALKEYIMLPSGAAIGRGCGPKIIARHPFSLDEIRKKKIAIPGANTTANLLFDVLCPPGAVKHYCLYSEMIPLLQNGVVDAGLIIHETRFTFQKEGMVEIADLGELWETQTHLPIPLGGILAKRSLGKEKLQQITKAIQDSLSAAWEDPKASEKYILQHSQEKDPHIVKQHIDLYVNEESHSLSSKAIQSIDTLFSLARKRDPFPSPNIPWLFQERKTAERTVVDYQGNKH